MADSFEQQIIKMGKLPRYNDVTGEEIKELPKRPQEDILKAKALESVTQQAAQDIEKKVRAGRGVENPSSVQRKAKGGMVRGVGKALRGYGKGKII